ncbi:hypothetical protein EDB89DRAFT_2244939 [Lactarius sanguifluus]|nr:hypothetical protein EDB89DRAFT_2244939 [Lactarius sanguifluus]
MAIIPVTTAGYRTRPARLLQLQRNGSLPMACRSSLFRYFPPFNLGPGPVHHTISVLHSHSSLACQIKCRCTFLVLDLGDTATVARLLLQQKYHVSKTLKTGSDRFFRSDYLTGTVAELRANHERCRCRSAYNASWPDILIPGRTNGTRQVREVHLGDVPRRNHARHPLLALVDAVPQPILFGSKASEQALRARHGGAQLRRDGSEEDDAAAALVEDPEKLVPATLQCLKRQEIVQEHFGYEPCEVSLRDAALVVRRSARLSAYGLRQRAREGRVASSVVGVGGKLYFVPALSWLRGVHAGGLRILLGEEVEKRVETGLAKDGSGVGITLGALRATNNKIF